MADKIVAHVSQQKVVIVMADHQMVQQVVNAWVALVKLFHFEESFKLVYHDEEEGMLWQQQAEDAGIVQLPQVQDAGGLNQFPAELDNEVARHVSLASLVRGAACSGNPGSP